MITDGIGLYVHIPFCKSKCKYCDFASFSGLSDEVREGYLNALISEIASYKREEKIRVNTVFFGGGTPSLLSARDMAKIMSAARDAFEISDDAEITVEVNPKTVDKEKLAGYYSLGINRLSIGMQSIHENELKILGRNQTFEDFLVRHSIRFFDPQTVMVQRTSCGFRLRVPDFEPATRTLIPFEAIFPALVRKKIRRRFARFRRAVGIV